MSKQDKKEKHDDKPQPQNDTSVSGASKVSSSPGRDQAEE